MEGGWRLVNGDRRGWFVIWRNGERGAGRVRRGGFDADMGRAEFLQAGTDGAVGEFRTVAVAAEVPKVKVSEIGGNDLFGKLRGGVVGKVPVPAQDALLRGPRAAGVILEHLHIVVGFKDENVRGADAFDDEPGGVAEIREEADVAGSGAQEEAHGVAGIMRDAESIHGDIAEFKAGTGVEQVEIEPGLELGFDGFLGGPIAIDGYLQFGREHAEALGVVAVFVRDENAAQALRSSSNPQQPLADLPGAEPGVDEQAGVVGFQVGAVAAGTAGEDGEPGGHAATLGSGRGLGKLKSAARLTPPGSAARITGAYFLRDHPLLPCHCVGLGLQRAQLMWQLCKEFLLFLRQEKKWWLVPLVILLLILGALIIFSSGSVLAPLMYPFM